MKLTGERMVELTSREAIESTNWKRHEPHELLGARKLLGAKGIATRSRDATRE